MVLWLGYSEARGSYILQRVPVYTPGAIEVSTRTDDGWTLRGERLVCEDAPVVVVLGHAMMVDRRTLDRPAGAGLASTLHDRGLDVTWLDARGHGESGPTAAEGARWSYDDIVRHDVPAFVRLAREVADGRPVVLLGHSLIGHAGLIAAGLNPAGAPDAIVAYAPSLWKPSFEPNPARRAQKTVLLRAWAIWARVGGFFDPRHFELGGAAVAEPYIRQFLEMWRSDRLEDGRGDDYEAAIGRADVDLLAVSSRNDSLFARVDSVAQFVGLARNARVEERVLEGDGAPSHIGFVTDEKSKTLWEETATWILARSA